MTAAEIVNKYEVMGVKLWANDGRLHFKAPSDTLNDEHLGELKAHKEALLAYFERVENISITPDPANDDKPFPVTDVQAAYLVGRADTYAYGGVGCHGYVEFGMPVLDHARLEEAWRKVVARHGMLRAMVSRDGFQQVLNDTAPPTVRFHDLRGLSSGDAETRLRQVRDELSVKQYDPGQPPMCELALSTTDSESILHSSIDMLIADFVSVEVMLSELDTLYHEPDTELPPLEISFRDVVLFRRMQRELPSHTARRDLDRRYWLERIETMPGGPDLPILGGRERVNAVAFMRHGLTLDAKDWRDFCAHASEFRLTPSCAVLAAFAETIGRWAGRPSFCINVTMLNRPQLHPQIDRIVGDFTDVNILEVSTSAGETFAERARIVQDRLWRDMEHTAFSGVEVLREINRRSDTRSIYPVVFTSLLGLGDEKRQDGEFMRGARLLYGISQTPQVWIDCQAGERHGELHLNWDIRAGIFPEGMMEDAFESFRDLLGRLAREPGLWKGASPIRLPARTTTVREAVNNTAMPMTAGLIHDGFHETLRRAPNSTALVADGRSYTYVKLGGQAAAVRQALAAAGCVEGDLVAIMQPKSAGQIASVLGTLYAGAAYLPIDMNEPAARRNAILTDAGVRAVLVQGEVYTLPEDVLRVDVSRLAPEDTGLLSLKAKDPSGLAYVIYTSGTTGAPKGVVTTHRAVRNTLEDINRRFSIGAKDVLLGVANLNFDLSVYDIFGTFLAGATLVLPEESRRSDPGHWARLIFEHRVSIWNSVPAQMHMLLTFLEGESPLEKSPPLRVALLSGDWIPVSLPPLLRGYCPDITVMSLGGATEAAIWSIGHEIPEDLGNAVAVPYGTPLANQTFHVLDDRMRPSPDWVPGHLYIGGAGLALGYLGDDERTSERFVTHPESGRRLYSTGDLGRYRPDGVIEFLGRDDTQVKIRGHRIELGEVESVLQSHPAVASAVALVAGGTPEQSKLAAFVEARRHTEEQPPEEVVSLGEICTAAGDRTVAGINKDLLARWFDLSDQTALLGMLGTLRSFDLFSDSSAKHSFEEIMEAGRVSAKLSRLMSRWLSALCREKLLVLDEKSGRYRLGTTHDDQALPLRWEELESVEDELNYGRGLLNYLRLSGAHLPELLQGQADPLDLLFPQGGMETALSAYNDNIMSRCLNDVARAAVGTLADARRDRRDSPLRVLEIGAGVGGTTRALIEHLDGKPVEYHFTDVSTFFLNEAREVFGNYPWVSYGLFDINKPYWEQGVEAGSFDVILCANVLHNSTNAPDVLRTLGEISAPGGVLLIIEATGKMYSLLTSMEFKEGLTGFSDVRAETGQTFFTADQWVGMLGEAGADVLCRYPVPENPLARAEQTVFITRFISDRMPVSARELGDFVVERLPKHMVPAHIEVLPHIPLSANGKVDRKKLQNRVDTVEFSVARSGEEPLDGLEKRIADIWATALNKNAVWRNEDFFTAGGDSLLIAQVVARMRDSLPEAKEWEWDRLMREVLQEPTVAAVATKLSSGAEKRPAVPGSDGKRTLGGAPLTILAPGASGTKRMTVFFHTGNGNLAPYRHLFPSVIGMPGRTNAIAGLSVADFDGFLAMSQEGLIEELGRIYARSIMESNPEHVHLVGYCSGGLIAFEAARVLLEEGVDTDPLSLVSSGPFRYRVCDEMLMERAFGRLFGADVVRAGHFEDEVRLGEAINLHLAGHAGVIEEGFLESLDGAFADIGRCYKAIARKTQDERLADIAAALPNSGADTTEYQVGVTRLLYKIFNHTFGAVARYNPVPLLHDIRLFQAMDTSLHAIPGVQSDIRAFWQDAIIGDIEVIDVAGNHMSCMQPPNVSVIAGTFSGMGV